MTTPQTIYLAGDHWGFALLPQVRDYLEREHRSVVISCGPHEHDPDDDYPDFIKAAATAVAVDPVNRRAIIFGKTGQGEAICANRFKGVRATVYYGGPTEIITLSREHNDANVLSLGAGFLELSAITDAITLWLTTPYSEEPRHQRRIAKIDAS